MANYVEVIAIKIITSKLSEIFVFSSLNINITKLGYLEYYIYHWIFRNRTAVKTTWNSWIIRTGITGN